MNQRTPQQDAKSSNVAQDDEQHTRSHSDDDNTKGNAWYLWKSLI